MCIYMYIYIYIYIYIDRYTIYILEKEIATHSSILAWENPWTEEPGVLQFMGSQRIRHNIAIEQ